MRLEEEIKQTRPFKNNYEKIFVNIIYTSNWLNLQQHKKLKKFDISSQQYNVLRILNGQNGKPITINEIIERMLDKMSNASRLVDKLFLKGLVTRDQRPDNRRACDVTITQKGKDILAEITSEIQLSSNDLGNISEAELELLSDLLDKVRF